MRRAGGMMSGFRGGAHVDRWRAASVDTDLTLRSGTLFDTAIFGDQRLRRKDTYLPHRSLGPEPKPRWGRVRSAAHDLLHHNVFEGSMAFVIILNTVLVVYETDERAKCETSDITEDCAADAMWLFIMNQICLAVYVLEVMLRLFVYRKKFVLNNWNNFDALVVVVNLLSEIMGGALPAMTMLRALRMLRAVRLAKVFRILLVFRELYLIIYGFLSAMRAIFWASILMFLLLSVWSIFAVELLHPINVELTREGVHEESGCKRCPIAFSSVMQADLTFMQTMVAGDSWGAFAIPLIERKPWCVFLFVAVFATVMMGFCNLILSVIVDTAAEARVDDMDYQLRQQELEAETAKANLYKLFQKLDADGDGGISMEELVKGFEENREFAQTLNRVNISRDDLGIVFSILDEDKNGNVDYKEFIEQLYKMQSADIRMLVMFVKFYVMEIRNHVIEGLEENRKELMEAWRSTEFMHAPEPATAARGSSSKPRPDSPSRESSVRDRASAGARRTTWRGFAMPTRTPALWAAGSDSSSSLKLSSKVLDCMAATDPTLSAAPGTRTESKLWNVDTDGRTWELAEEPEAMLWSRGRSGSDQLRGDESSAEGAPMLQPHDRHFEKLLENTNRTNEILSQLTESLPRLLGPRPGLPPTPNAALVGGSGVFAAGAGASKADAGGAAGGGADELRHAGAALGEVRLQLPPCSLGRHAEGGAPPRELAAAPPAWNDAAGKPSRRRQSPRQSKGRAAASARACGPCGRLELGVADRGAVDAHPAWAPQAPDEVKGSPRGPERS